MPIDTLTTLHVVISLVALGAGLMMLAALLVGRNPPALVAVVLATTLATTLTGYLFPSGSITPAQIVGYISLATLAVAIVSYYFFKARGGWGIAYVAGMVASVYLNAFVAVAQSFQKLPSLQKLAPTGSETPFVAAQSVLLVAIVVGGWIAARRIGSAA